MKNEEIKILIVDDNPDIREVLHILLESEGYQIREASNGGQALALADQDTFDLVLLDIMMPGISGIETCHLLHQKTAAPILFLTARSQEADKQAAYSGGGDDYLVKPFSQPELLLKVHSLLRRYCVYRGKAETGDDNFVYLREVTIDVDKRLVTKNGNPVELTNKELAILLFMVTQKGVVLSIENIFESVWREKYLPASSNTVMVHMLNLRKKLEDDPNNPQIIRTVWGRGYQIDD